MSNAKHSEQSQTEGIHTSYRWTWANAAARTAQTGVTAEDVTNAATGLQLDTNVVYRATDEDPLTWQAINSTASGDVTGPGSSTDNALVRFDGTTGKILQNGAAVEDDEGKVTVTKTDAGTTDVQEGIVVSRRGGTVGAGFGTGLKYQAKTSTTLDVDVARSKRGWSDHVHASRRGFTRETLIYAGNELEWLSVEAPDYVNGAEATPDNRGTFSLEMQPLRSNNDEVASGNGSFIIWGEDAKASGASAGVIAGYQNYATTDQSIIIGGKYGRTTMFGELVLMPMRRGSGTEGVEPALATGGTTTSDATPKEAGLGSLSSSPSQFINLEDNHAYGFTVWIVARRPANNDCAFYELKGGIKRGAGVGTTALIGTVDKVAKEDAGAAAWDVSATADTTNGRLAITVTGEAAATINWFMTVLLFKLA